MLARFPTGSGAWIYFRKPFFSHFKEKNICFNYKTISINTYTQNGQKSLQNTLYFKMFKISALSCDFPLRCLNTISMIYPIIFCVVILFGGCKRSTLSMSVQSPKNYRKTIVFDREYFFEHFFKPFLNLGDIFFH